MATANDDNVELEDNIEEVLTKYYFYRGFQYTDILDFLTTFHNIEISERTLHRRRFFLIFLKNTSEQHTATDLVNLLYFSDRFRLIIQTSSGSLKTIHKGTYIIPIL